MPWRRKHTAPEPPEALLGVWFAEGGRDRMEFLANGRCIYTVPGPDEELMLTPDREGLMLLTYRVEGDEIVSNQPSHPNEERTRYTLNGDVLTLTFQGEATHWRRQS